MTDDEKEVKAICALMGWELSITNLCKRDIHRRRAYYATIQITEPRGLYINNYSATSSRTRGKAAKLALAKTGYYK